MILYRVTPVLLAEGLNHVLLFVPLVRDLLAAGGKPRLAMDHYPGSRQGSLFSVPCRHWPYLPASYLDRVLRLLGWPFLLLCDISAVAAFIGPTHPDSEPVAGLRI